MQVVIQYTERERERERERHGIQQKMYPYKALIYGSHSKMMVWTPLFYFIYLLPIFFLMLKGRK
jgi:hypothetical protein